MKKQKHYGTYVDWKGWDKPLAERDRVRLWAYYTRVVERAGINKGSRLLEIGFGNGYFLEWARSHGYKITGVEILPEMVEKFKKLGFDVRNTPLSEMIKEDSGSYDFIVAFDVLEHLDKEEIHELLTAAGLLLHSEGKMTARFPNGGSPFGMYFQNGDITHKTCLTKPLLAQLTRETGLRLKSCDNTPRVSEGSRNPVRRKCGFLVRSLFEKTVGLAYFGRRIPLDPTLSAVWDVEKEKKTS